MMVAPGVLEGNIVRLEPLTLEHLPGLIEVGLDPVLSEWTVDVRANAGDMQRFVENAIEERVAGRAYPFATIDRRTGTIVGSTRFANISTEHKRLEIGWTWVAKPWQRTGVNTEAKYLMFEYAFEVLQLNRVEIKTDALNIQSRAAIERVGGRYEGTLRSHIVCDDGRVRDTVYYSVVVPEWPEVKRHLQGLLVNRA